MKLPVGLRCVLLVIGIALGALPAAALAQPQGELSLLPPVTDESPLPPPDMPGDQNGTPALPASFDDTPGEIEAEATGAGAGEEAEDAAPEGDAAEASVEETVQEPWYYPDVMFDRGLWTGSMEFGLNGTTGNAETMSFRTGADVKHKVDCNTLALTLAFARTQADGKETQNNALFTARDDWDFCDSMWLLFMKETTEYDEFKAFDVRIAANAGLGYYIVKQDNAKFKLRSGAGASHEIGGPNDDVVPEAVFGYDIEACVTSRQKIEGTADYLPSFADWGDFRVESRMSWAIQLDDAAKLSLKFSVIDRYDSTPEGRRPNDLDYAALLMWKL